MFIELMGRINDKGELEVTLPANMPPGQVRIVIEPFDSEAEAADEALWDEQFARSKDVRFVWQMKHMKNIWPD